MQTIYVTKGNLVAGASTGLGTFSSGGAGLTIGATDLDQARRIIVWGSSFLGPKLTIVGLSETRTQISETITTSTLAGGVTQTNQDFLRVLSATFLSTTITSTAGYIGTSSQAGTSWKAVDTTRNPVNLAFQITFSSTLGAVASFEYSQAYPDYSYQTGMWSGSTSLTGPIPTISSMGSSVTAATQGFITTPISAWRMTLSSSSSAVGAIYAAVTQTG